ncbi:MAG: hypothetical protein JWN25_3067, partial [Verrucomicrobiales bacterium]|nr:hypothetical protein [Verrucomicrobiales bacterium]
MPKQKPLKPISKTNVLLAASSLAVTHVLSVSAADAPAPAPVAAPSAGLVNDWLRTQSPNFNSWDLGGQIRLRGEYKGYFNAAGVPGAVDFSAKGDKDNSYLLLREKIHLGFSPTPWATFFVEGRDAREWNDDRSPSPDADTFDLFQAYIKLGDPKTFPVTLKIGRQELIYGDERLIGASDFTNVGRTFDAAKLRWEGTSGFVDLFTARVVIPDDNNLNLSNDYDTFSGIYAGSKTIVPKFESEAYFLARNVEKGSPSVIKAGLPPGLTGATPRDIYTIGMRFKSLPKALGNWDLEGEFAGQFGRFKSTVAGPSLDQEAFAAHAAGGYTFNDVSIKPRVGLEYNFASGDNNSKDGKHQTFENLFPTNHKFYGYMDFISWQNIHNVRLTSSIKPMDKLTVSLDYHAFWLADTEDFFYQVNGAARSTGGYGIKPKAGSYVGSEIDLITTYTIKPYAIAQAGYG